MKKRPPLILMLACVSLLQLGLARNPSQNDEEARRAEQETKRSMKESETSENPAGRFVEGVKQVTVDSTAGFLSETAGETRSSAPVVGTLEGARKGSESILDNTVKGASKVATLGFGEVKDYDVVEPEDNSEEPTKISIKIPGT